MGLSVGPSLANGGGFSGAGGAIIAPNGLAYPGVLTLGPAIPSPYAIVRTPPSPVVFVSPGMTLAQIQTALNSVPPGGSLVFNPGTYDFAGGTLNGQSNLTIWALPTVTINNALGANGIGMGGLSNWTVRGATPGALVLNGFALWADSCSNWIVGNCIFNNSPPGSGFASSIRCTDTNTGGVGTALIINCDFNNVYGDCVIGEFDWNNITIDGCHFTNVAQSVSINSDVGTWGANITFIRNITTGQNRAGFETGGVGEPFSNLKIINNWFVNGAGQTVPPISIVCGDQINTIVTGNYLFAGPNAQNVSNSSQAIEMASDHAGAPAVVATNNLIVGWLSALAQYPTNGGTMTFANNKLYQNGDNALWAPGNTVLLANPGTPQPPRRVRW